MKIKLMDNVLEQDGLDLKNEYEVIKTETVRDDLYYIVINETGKEIEVHELLAKKI